MLQLQQTWTHRQVTFIVSLKIFDLLKKQTVLTCAEIVRNREPRPATIAANRDTCLGNFFIFISTFLDDNSNEIISVSAMLRTLVEAEEAAVAAVDTEVAVVT